MYQLFVAFLRNQHSPEDTEELPVSIVLINIYWF